MENMRTRIDRGDIKAERQEAIQVLLPAAKEYLDISLTPIGHVRHRCRPRNEDAKVEANV